MTARLISLLQAGFDPRTALVLAEAGYGVVGWVVVR